MSAGIQTQALGSGRRIAGAAEALLVGPNEIALQGVLPALICAGGACLHRGLAIGNGKAAISRPEGSAAGNGPAFRRSSGAVLNASWSSKTTGV